MQFGFPFESLLKAIYGKLPCSHGWWLVIPRAPGPPPFRFGGPGVGLGGPTFWAYGWSPREYSRIKLVGEALVVADHTYAYFFAYALASLRRLLQWLATAA